MVPRLDDTALLAGEGRPVVVEEFAQRPAFGVDEPVHRQIHDLVGKSGPGDAVESLHLLARKTGLQEVHMRIGAERQARRVILLEAGERMLAMSLEPSPEIVAAPRHLGSTLRQGFRHMGEGKQGEGLVVEIERSIDQLAVGIRQRPVKAARPSVDTIEIEQAAFGGCAPVSIPAAPARRGETVDLPGLHAGAAIGARRFALHGRGRARP